MRQILRRCAVVLTCSTLLTSVLSTGAATAAPEKDQVQEFMDRTVAAGVPGVFAVTRDGDRRWRGSSGVGDVRTEREPWTGGRFRIGSVSKTFTGALVLQLAGEGEFGLDDTIQEHLPGLLPYDEPITIRQLLQHTSGLPRDLPPEHTWESAEEIDTERFASFTPREVVKLSASQPLRFRPGTDWAYSNTGFAVLGLLVEEVTETSLKRALRHRILWPLGLHDTWLPGDFPFLPLAATRGYEQLYAPERGLTDVTTYNYSRFFGIGNVVSSAQDVNHFFRALLGGKLLHPDMLAQMKRTVPAPGPNGEETGLRYGLGLMEFDLGRICPGAEPVRGHGGDLPGFGTWSWHDERGTKQVTTAINKNLSAGPQAKGMHQLAAFAEFCRVPTPPTTLTTAPVAPLPSLGPVPAIP
ncbi:serine hydrolase domain-containing protein [Amycolatopsis cihanbeyliensis]|uniref:D-alanyl-D-alanine carboxypeptidase n=1 Tax=Amycolatopsis cihanbeyliensis TaxID=1128664 RepID=A0A542DIR6_AMYCI|nr:serine hydrolase domain-containing protein [Amycolatopsis cihanbeyliensis]TQJ03002.1 D-alanyl-D-alanine carboxypeptidase [Amycolatopsis cihanbeyliensis]